MDVTDCNDVFRDVPRNLTSGEVERAISGIQAGLETSGVPFTPEAEAAARAVLGGEMSGDEAVAVGLAGTEPKHHPVSNGYYYPGAAVLRKRFGSEDPHTLVQIEALVAATRMAELAVAPVNGHFDFAHLQAIHRRLLGDLYEWAGEIRTTDTAQNDLGILYDPPSAIPEELDRVFGDINSGVYVNHHSHDYFVHDLAGHWGDLTRVHPFIDGNFRSQMAFFDQLARAVGWAVEWRGLSVNAVRAARNFAYVDGGTILADVLRPAIKPVAEVPLPVIVPAPRVRDWTFRQHWQAMLEHFDATPELHYTAAG